MHRFTKHGRCHVFQSIASHRWLARRLAQQSHGLSEIRALRAVPRHIDVGNVGAGDFGAQVRHIQGQSDGFGGQIQNDALIE
jgi:hypothetical protein